MTYEISGFINGRAYTATLNEKASGKPNSFGLLDASSSPLLGMLHDLSGESVMATPTGPYVPVGPGSAEGIMAALVSQTVVTEVLPQMPDLWPSGSAPELTF